MTLHRKSMRILGGVLLAYALLVATHLGEFWPFSVYPMFSQAGNPWTRAVVREMPTEMDPDTLSWREGSLDALPGSAYPVAPRGINQNDVANYVSKTEEWTEERIDGLRSLFTKNRSLSSPLLVMRVRGELAGDSVAVTTTPVMLFTPDSTVLHPSPDARTIAGSSSPPE